MSDEKPKLPETMTFAREVVAVATSLVLSSAGLAYVLGLLIINIRLGALGVPAPDLTQPRYALVGALYLFLVGLTASAVGLGIVGFREAMLRMKGHQPVLAWIQLLTSFGAPVVAPIAAVQFLSQNHLDYRYRETWFILFILLLSAINFLPITEHLAYLWKWGSARQDRPFVAVASVYSLLWQMLMLAMGITGYSLSAYPRLAPVFGGGRPSQIVMFVSPDKIAVVRMSGLPVANDGRTQAVFLLFEDASNYYVESRSASQTFTARIRKEEILLTLHPLPSR